MNNTIMEESLGIYEAARYVGLSYYKFRVFVDAKALRTVNRKTQIRIPISELEQFKLNREKLEAELGSVLKAKTASLKRRHQESLAGKTRLGLYEAARYLQTRYEKLLAEIEAGSIPYIKRDGKILIKVEDLDKFKSQQQKKIYVAPEGYLDIGQITEITGLPKQEVYDMVKPLPHILAPKTNKKLIAITDLLPLIPTLAETLTQP